MGILSRTSLWRASCAMLVILLSLAAGEARGQWSEVGAYTVGPFSWGAMYFGHGVLWAGDGNLVSSIDSGKSWVSANFPAWSTTGISFFSKDVGCVSTSQNGIYRTSDGGITWTLATPLGAWCISYGKSDSVIYAIGLYHFLSSTDGGNTWKESQYAATMLGLCVNADGSIYATGGDSPSPGIDGGFVYSSTDNGTSWQHTSAPIDVDCYSLCVNPCRTTQICVANEDHAWLGNGYSKLYVTSDGGKTWKIGFSHPTPYLCGSVSESPAALYAQMLTGVLRSTDSGITWKNIGGPGTEPDSRDVFAVNDNLIFAMDSRGNIWKTSNSGGDSVRAIDPVERLVTSTNTLFATDTVACDSVSHSVTFIRTGCSPPSVSTYYIIGPDSASYVASEFSYDSILVTLHPISRGSQNAKLVLNLDNGESDTVTLAGYINRQPNILSTSCNTLFVADTISCDSLTHSISFIRSGCSPPSISSYSIIGPDSSSFEAGNLSNDSILITLRSIKQGNQNAKVVLNLDDGASDTVTLAGFVNRPPDILSTSSNMLFEADTISCDSLTFPIAFTRSGCSPPSVASYSIIGPDSVSFEASNLSYDSILVTLRGIKQGSQNAKLVLNLDNGASDTVTLGGYVYINRATTAISTENESTDTLGATVRVPITIHGLTKPEDVHLVLHYDGSVDYLGSFSPTGVRLDIPGDSSYRRSVLHIAGAVPYSIAGYAEFNVFSDSGENAHVTFDSLDILTAVSPCAYSPAPAVTSTIFPPKGCDIPILSQLIHLGREPLLSVRPNPATGHVWITASGDLGVATIVVYDMLGTVQSESQSVLRNSVPVELAMPAAGGVYTILVKAGIGTFPLRVVCER